MGQHVPVLSVAVTTRTNQATTCLPSLSAWRVVVPHLWRYDTQQELELLNPLWRLVSLRLNFFTPTTKAVGYTTTADGSKKRIYDKPAIPWQRPQARMSLTRNTSRSCPHGSTG